MKVVARGLARRFDHPDRIICSKAERARATAEFISNAFGGMGVDEQAELNPGARPAAYLRLLAEAMKNEEALLLIVGHEPDLSEAVSKLVAAGQLQMKFKKAACADVELVAPNRGVLRALVDPAVWSD